MIEHEDHCPEKGDRRCDCDYEARVRADERKRIAQAIEKEHDNRPRSDTVYTAGLANAARIARNGGSDG